MTQNYERDLELARGLLEDLGGAAKSNNARRLLEQGLLLLIASLERQAKQPVRKTPRTAKRLCACGCGEVIKPTMQPGRAPLYVNNTHRVRASRARIGRSETRQ